MQSVEEFLKNNGIEYVLHEHPAVFTCEEAEKHCSHVPGVSSKNLFLRDEKKQRYFLVILDAKKRADLKKLGEIFEAKRLSFANEDDLKQKLGLEPGAVSLFGILNDVKQEVEVYIDEDFYKEPVVNFHPNRNTASVELSKEMLHKFIEKVGREIKVVKIG